MSQFRADLHIHSRFSRATSKRLGVRQLAAWAAIKGLQVLGTGDFTHPGWRAELQEQLVRDESTGLYRLRSAERLSQEVPELLAGLSDAESCLGLGQTLFVPQAEISSIYKRDGKVRKVHNLVFMPDFEAVDRLCQKLEAIGNLASDGRPILGLDSRLLLEMVLETDSRGVLIPAHIWTPWFALFGSRSGFDSIEECFGDLSSEIFALETGLSSDPAMNRLWSHLDRFTCISNSDAHSGENLGREANEFFGTPSYDGLFGSLKDTTKMVNGCRFTGTLEFFPEEGKYHLDGHRNCGVVFEPHESKAQQLLCPVCQKPLTIGVLHRVTTLADRLLPEALPLKGSFRSLIPLPTLIGELLGVGAKSKKVQSWIARLLALFGSELHILQDVPEFDLRHVWEPLGEGIARMRRGDVIRHGGYDGEYGVVSVFNDAERAAIQGTGRLCRPSLLTDGMVASRHKSAELVPHQVSNPTVRKQKILFDSLETPSQPTEVSSLERSSLKINSPKETSSRKALLEKPSSKEPLPEETSSEEISSRNEEHPFSLVNEKMRCCAQKTCNLDAYNEEQQAALMSDATPLLVLAGPGTGKTRTLIGRIEYLTALGVAPESIAAVTFTRRAAVSMQTRLEESLTRHSLDISCYKQGNEQDKRVVSKSTKPTQKTAMPCVDTLHAFALRALRSKESTMPLLLSESQARVLFVTANPELSADMVRESWNSMMLCRERRESYPEALGTLYHRYAAYKKQQHAIDYTDLLEMWLAMLRTGEGHMPWQYVLVDEIQDLSPLQLELIAALLPQNGAGFFGIGDPDQSIYGFRGAHGGVKAFCESRWPALRVVTLRKNYRSAPAIVALAGQALAEHSVCGRLESMRELNAEHCLVTAPTAEREAAWIAYKIKHLIGSTAHTILDAQRESASLFPAGCMAPEDIAVLVRTKSLVPVLERALTTYGVPCSVPEADAFWHDAQVALLLDAAMHRRTSSVERYDDAFPATMLDYSPRLLPELMLTIPNFDRLFWQGTAFKQLVSTYEEQGGWEALLSWIALHRELETLHMQSGRVHIMTLHASKGLEFRAVFLPALEDGVLPLDASVFSSSTPQDSENSAHMDEERRLFYVGITRASEALYMSHAHTRRYYGEEHHCTPSPFLIAIRSSMRCTSLVRHTKRKTKQLSLLG